MSERTVRRPDDEDLVKQIQRAPGSGQADAAARELFDRYRERVYLWCYRRVRNHEAALDLSQDVLISAYRSAGAFQGRCRYSTWLFTITRNRCIRALRRPTLTSDEESDPDELPSELAGPEAALEERQREDELLDLVRRVLEPDEQTALWMRCFEKLPVEEITRRMKVTQASGARGLLQTARRKLRAALAERDGQGSERDER